MFKKLWENMKCFYELTLLSKIMGEMGKIGVGIAMKSDIESNVNELMELRLMCTKSVTTFFTSL